MEELRAAVVPQQPKGGDELRRNRRVLQDIGNRPITWSFHAQLIAKAQEKGVNNANPVVLPVLDDKVNDFVCLSDYAYTANQILRMEKAILGKLEWYLTVPTPYVFLSRCIKASVSPDVEIKNMVFFLSEVGILHYPTIILYSPSLIAAAAVYAAHFIGIRFLSGLKL